MRMNLHRTLSQYDKVECSGSKPRGKEQSCVGYQVWFEMSVIVLCKSRGVERVRDAGGVFNAGRKQNGGEGEKIGYIYLSSSDLLVQLVLLVNEHKTTQHWSCRTTRCHMNEEPPNEI
jgi:hypothetical protein